MKNTNIVQYMTQAFELAKGGLNKTGLNPLVGALIVKNGKIIGKGFHNEFGGDHAEIVAIKDAEKKKYNVKNQCTSMNVIQTRPTKKRAIGLITR